MKRACAYCKADMGETDDGEEGVTHGMCPSCVLDWNRDIARRRINKRLSACAERFREVRSGAERRLG